MPPLPPSPVRPVPHRPLSCRPSAVRPASTLPAGTGIGLKRSHVAALRAQRPGLAFVEVHAENYMGDGGPPHAELAALCADYALSVHGVGLSIGGAGPLDDDHLTRLARLCDRYAPDSFSEHLAWSSHDGASLNDLLPLPYTAETLTTVCDHIDRVQTALRRPMLLENPATYVTFDRSTLSETDFLRAIVARTGCGLLLDINNVFVSCTNHRNDPRAYLADFPLTAVGEIHLGGHHAEDLPSGPLLIDNHGAAVADPVWTLYAETIARTGPVPTLIEWDTDVPDLPVLLAEADRAAAVMGQPSVTGGRHAVAS